MDFVKEEIEKKEQKKKVKYSKWIILSIVISIIIILIIVATQKSGPSTALNLNNTTQCILNKNQNTLILTQILFRHGERTPMVCPVPYPKDPYKDYTYEPIGLGAVTPVGKQTLFRLGKYLKSYYYNLLKDYNRDIVYALSSPMIRCRISLLIILAAMFQPEKSEYLQDDLNWQPIPYESKDFKKDTTFLSFINCERFTYLYREETKKSVKNNDVNNFKEILEELFIHTGTKYSTYRDLFALSIHLKTQKEFGLLLPSWTEDFMPILEQFEILTYNISGRTEGLKTLSGGFLLTEIVNAMKSKMYNPKMHHRKIHLYSGHDFTIANLMGTIGQYSNKIIPYGAFLSFELHQINTKYAVKILYYQPSYVYPEPLILEGCFQELCPYETFIAIYGKYMATPDMCILDEQFKLTNSSEHFFVERN